MQPQLKFPSHSSQKLKVKFLKCVWVQHKPQIDKIILKGQKHAAGIIFPDLEMTHNIKKQYGTGTKTECRPKENS